MFGVNNKIQMKLQFYISRNYSPFFMYNISDENNIKLFLRICSLYAQINLAFLQR